MVKLSKIGIFEKMITGEIPKISFLEKSPLINAKVYVQEDSRCAYLYLVANANTPNSITNCVWLRNFKVAPRKLDKVAEKRGLESMMYKEGCSHPKGIEGFESKLLSVVWLDEGNGVALYYDEELIAIIPYLNPSCNYFGYSKECINETEIAKPLSKCLDAKRMIDRSKEFWKIWNEDKWTNIKEKYLNSLEKVFNVKGKEYVIDNSLLQPKSILEYDKGVVVYLATVGMSINPQPLINSKSYDKYKRIEIIFPVSKRIYESYKDEIIECLGELSCYPWKNLRFINNGDVITSSLVKEISSRIKNILVVDGQESNYIPNIKIGKFRGENIKFLWAIPISSTFDSVAKKYGYMQVFRECKKTEGFYVFNG